MEKMIGLRDSPLTLLHFLLPHSKSSFPVWTISFDFQVCLFLFLTFEFIL